MSLNPGTRIGHYEIIAKLGEGGMGEVYRARDEQLSREVAIKILRPTLTDERATERLLREARAEANVRHPNVCHVYEVGEDAGRPYIVMELLEGDSLAARIASGSLPLPEAVQITLTVLSAVQALHELNLVHRDLKPSNVCLTAQGAKLLDFGLARQVDPSVGQTETSLTLPGTLVGTPHYMAPEQVLGQVLDGRADLFAISVMLFEMLTGSRPFDGDSAMTVFHAILHEQPPALVGSAGIGAVDRVLRRALAKEPSERQASADAMAEELRAALLVADSGEAPTVRRVTRLAALPFRLLRPDPDIEFLAFSLADAVVASLSGLESLVVRSSLVSARFAGDALDLKQIAKELDIDVLLTGTLLRAGERLRLSTQLVEVADGKVLWSQTSDVQLGDLFQLQDELVARIVGALPVTPRDQTRTRLAVPGNAKAYELYLRANQLSSDASTWALARDMYLEVSPGGSGLRAGVGAAGPTAPSHWQVRDRGLEGVDAPS